MTASLRYEERQRRRRPTVTDPMPSAVLPNKNQQIMWLLALWMTKNIQPLAFVKLVEDIGWMHISNLISFSLILLFQWSKTKEKRKNDTRKKVNLAQYAINTRENAARGNAGGQLCIISKLTPATDADGSYADDDEANYSDNYSRWTSELYVNRNVHRTLCINDSHYRHVIIYSENANQ